MEPLIRNGLLEQRREERLKPLITALLGQVALDIRALPEQDEGPLSEKVINAADALAFLNSDLFTLICDALGMKDTVMRNEILRRTKRGDLNDG